MSIRTKNKRIDETLEKEFTQAKKMKQISLKEHFNKTFKRIKITGDGNCLFRAILYCLFKDDSQHFELRQKVCQYMLNNRTDFEGFVDLQQGNFDDYIEEKRYDGIWGDEPELIAASQMLQFNFEVFDSKTYLIRRKHHYTSLLPTIYLEFYNNNHYNALNLIQNKVKIVLSPKNVTLDM